VIGGAAGTAALDVATYLDMVARGRPSSDVPAKVAGELAGRAGLPLEGDDPKTSARRSGAGALLGYATSLGLGAAYALLRRPEGGRRRALPLGAGVALGLAAMALSDVPAVAAGATDPRRWGLPDWLSDLVPHVVYGVVTAAVVETASTCAA
jgi:hypothetical protein